MELRDLDRAAYLELLGAWHHRHCDVSYETPWDEQATQGRRSRWLTLNIAVDDSLFVVEDSYEVAPGARFDFDAKRYCLLYQGDDPAAAVAVYETREVELKESGLRLHARGGLAQADALAGAVDFQRRRRNGELSYDEAPSGWEI